MNASACLACDLNAGRRTAPGGVIYQDELWLADHGVDRLVRGYVILKPQRHVHELADLTQEEAVGLGVAVKRLLGAMRSALQPERIYVCSFAETLLHLHFHLLPRYADMPALGPDLVAAMFAGTWACTEEDAENAARSIRAALRT